jgi:PncC family amidohydrolase
VTNSTEFILGNLLSSKNTSLAIAESCTGGLISDRITNVSGSSEYFLGGIVAYSYEAKVNLLKVSWDTLRQFGAVSKETVIEMARGVLVALGADIAVSVSGIAGPEGGLADKPVGTTWIGLSTSERDWARHFVWSGDRIQNKESSAEAALQFVLDYLQGTL